jgi:hypothetical protein
MFGSMPRFLCHSEGSVNLQVNIFHCFLHREHLTSQRLLVVLDIVMKEVIQVVTPGPKVLNLKWMLILSYLLAVLAEISNLNIPMRGHDQTLFGPTKKLTTFKQS